MYLVVFVLIGLAVSSAARLLGKKNRIVPVRVSVISGVVGALAGGLVGRMIGLHGDETELAGASLAVLGATVALLSVHAVARGRTAAGGEAREIEERDS